MVDARKARDYMDDNVNGPGPILAQLVEALATDQPGPTRRDVLTYMRTYIDRLLEEGEMKEEGQDEQEVAEAPPCWLTGLPSEMKVRFPEKDGSRSALHGIASKH